VDRGPGHGGPISTKRRRSAGARASSFMISQDSRAPDDRRALSVGNRARGRAHGKTSASTVLPPRSRRNLRRMLRSCSRCVVTARPATARTERIPRGGRGLLPRTRRGPAGALLVGRSRRRRAPRSGSDRETAGCGAPADAAMGVGGRHREVGSSGGRRRGARAVGRLRPDGKLDLFSARGAGASRLFTTRVRSSSTTRPAGSPPRCRASAEWIDQTANGRPISARQRTREARSSRGLEGGFLRALQVPLGARRRECAGELARGMRSSDGGARGCGHSTREKPARAFTVVK